MAASQARPSIIRSRLMWGLKYFGLDKFERKFSVNQTHWYEVQTNDTQFSRIIWGCMASLQWVNASRVRRYLQVSLNYETCWLKNSNVSCAVTSNTISSNRWMVQLQRKFVRMEILYTQCVKHVASDGSAAEALGCMWTQPSRDSFNCWALTKGRVDHGSRDESCLVSYSHAKLSPQLVYNNWSCLIDMEQ